MYLNQPDVFVDVATDAQIVDTAVPQYLVVVDNEGSTQSNSSIIENAIALRDLHNSLSYLVSGVSKQGVLNISKTTLTARGFCPLTVRKVGIHRASQHFTSCFVELLSFVGELQDLGGADKGKVEGIEEQQQILVLVVIQGHLFKRLVARTPSC